MHVGKRSRGSTCQCAFRVEAIFFHWGPGSQASAVRVVNETPEVVGVTGCEGQIHVLAIDYCFQLNGIWRYEIYEADVVEEARQMVRNERLNRANDRIDLAHKRVEKFDTTIKSNSYRE